MADPIAVIRKNAREEIHITIGEFNGQQLFNARVYFKAEDGEMRPTNKGIAFRVSLLPEFTTGVTAALSEAKRRGLLP